MADDSLLFTMVITQEDDRILDILQKYQVSSGQMVNLDKSEAYFSRNVCEEDKVGLCSRMGLELS